MRFTKALLCLGLISGAFSATAQDNLVRQTSANSSDSAKRKFRFTPVINLECTGVKNQGSSGTCWSYSTSSFLESEMIRMGKKPVDLAEIFTARCQYIDKAENYLRMSGNLGWGDGGECHDVINMYAKYGAVPQDAYTGLTNGATRNRFSEMQAVLKGMLDAWIKNPNGRLNPNWRQAFVAVLDTYIGKAPERFTWNGQQYTPKTFASQVVGLNADDYIELVSYTHAPYYHKTMMWAPDNWSFDRAWNVPMADITTAIDYALQHGYTVTWAADVSEKSFSWKNGVAYMPEKEFEAMDETEMGDMFNGPKPERVITEQMRQQGLDDFSTTDDHGMHIIGIAKDQNGKEYYIVKNSWGDKGNDYKGFLYVTKPYVQLKTTAFLLHKGGLPRTMRDKMGV